MMKDVDTISRYVDPLVHQYNMTAPRFQVKDITKRLFVHRFDIFIRYINPRHVKVSDTLSISITISSITSISTLYYSPLNSL